MIKKYLILIAIAIASIFIINLVYSLIIFVQVYLHIQDIDIPDDGKCKEPYCFEVVNNGTFPGIETYIVRDHLTHKTYYVCDVESLLYSFIPQDAVVFKDADGSIKCYFWLRRLKSLRASLKIDCNYGNRIYKDREPYNIHKEIIYSIKNT